MGKRGPQPIYDYEEIRRLYAEHKMQSVVAKIVGCSLATVQRALRDQPRMPAQPRPRARRLPWDLMRKLHAEGKTDREIATAISKSPDSVTRWRHRQKLPLNPSNVMPRPPLNKGRYWYDRDLAERLIVKERRSPKEVSQILGCTVDHVYKLRRHFGVAKPIVIQHPDVLRARLKAAKDLLDDGVSYAEVSRTTHVSRKTLKKYYPGYQWTPAQCTQHALDIRYAEQRINKVWSAAGSTQSLTNPPLSR